MNSREHKSKINCFLGEKSEIKTGGTEERRFTVFVFLYIRRKRREEGGTTNKLLVIIYIIYIINDTYNIYDGCIYIVYSTNVYLYFP